MFFTTNWTADLFFFPFNFYVKKVSKSDFIKKKSQSRLVDGFAVLK